MIINDILLYIIILIYITKCNNVSIIILLVSSPYRYNTQVNLLGIMVESLSICTGALLETELSF